VVYIRKAVFTTGGFQSRQEQIGPNTVFSSPFTFFLLSVFFFRVSLSFHPPLSSHGYVLGNFTRNYQITRRHIPEDGNPLLIAASTSDFTKYSRDHEDSHHQDQGAVNSAESL
jgi:hypothetical protein